MMQTAVERDIQGPVKVESEKTLEKIKTFEKMLFDF